jgi:hypothetical protein
MLKAAARTAVLAALLCTASCLKIVDVVQPAEVEAGKKFEAALRLRAEGDLSEREGWKYGGVVAVSVPEGMEVTKAEFEGAAKGKLKESEALGPDYLPDRAGCSWVYWVTPKRYDAAEYIRKDFEVKLTLRAPDKAADYRLAYAAGAVTNEGSDENDDYVYWGSPRTGPDDDRILERWITIK